MRSLETNDQINLIISKMFGYIKGVIPIRMGIKGEVCGNLIWV